MTTVDKILELISKSGVTKKDFAHAIGVTPSTISEWKSERQNPISHISKIADYFNVSVDYLLGREEKEKEKPSTEAEGIAQRLSEIINNKYSKDELKSITDDDLNLISDIFIDTVKNVKKYKK